MAMSLSSTVSNEDKTRFCRLFLVIIEELTPILQDVLLSEVSPIHILNKVNLSTLRPDQIVVLNSAKTRGYKDFDITLLYTLLRNVCPNIPSPTQKWGISEMPLQNEITVGDDIERIRLIRNKVFAHKCEAAIPKKEFQEIWSIVSGICTRMQTLLNKNYIKKLQNAKECTIDSDTENRYMEKIKQMAQEEETMKQLLMKILADMELTSTANIKIETKLGRKTKFVETLTDTSIFILNKMVESILEMSESEIDQLYELIEDFIRENKEEIENENFQELHKKLRKEITIYANLHKTNQMNILTRFYKFNLEMKKKYGACVESSKGSLLLLMTFSSKRGYDLYKKDLESGEIGKQILQLFLYPPYLASFDLKPEDLVIYLNGRMLTQDTEDSTVDDLEMCSQHPNQTYTMACQQCQLPVCELCEGNPDHQGHVFTNLRNVFQEKLETLHEKLLWGHTLKNEVLIKQEKVESELRVIQDKMESKYQHLHNLLDRVLQQNTAELEKYQRTQTDQIWKSLNMIDKYISDQMNTLHKMSKSLPAQTLIHLKHASLRTDLMEFSKIDDPDFVEDEEITIQVVNDLFGKLKLPQMSIQCESGIEVDKIADDEFSDDEVIELPKILLATSFNVPNMVTHVTAVSENKAWVSDFYGGLYLLDDTGNVLQCLKSLSSGSGCHTITREGDLLYISPEKTIQKVSKDFEIMRLDIHIPHSLIACCIYSSHLNANLLVGMWSKSCSYTGAIIRYSEYLDESFMFPNNEDDEPLYEHPQYITENINQDVIVSDSLKGALVVTDAKGKFRFHYQGHSEASEFEPNGICTDSQAHIMVTDQITNSVQVLDEDGKFLFFLLTSNEVLDKPFSISFHLNNLWVGPGSNDRMLVYNVQYANPNQDEVQ